MVEWGNIDCICCVYVRLVCVRQIRGIGSIGGIGGSCVDGIIWVLIVRWLGNTRKVSVCGNIRVEGGGGEGWEITEILSVILQLALLDCGCVLHRLRGRLTR